MKQVPKPLIWKTCFCSCSGCGTGAAVAMLAPDRRAQADRHGGPHLHHSARAHACLFHHHPPASQRPQTASRHGHTFK